MSSYIINGITFIELNPEKKEAALMRGYEELIKVRRERGELELLDKILGKEKDVH